MRSRSLDFFFNVALLCVLVALSNLSVYAQNKRAMNKEDFLAALELGKQQGRGVEIFIELVKKNRVNFLLVSEEDEQQIRQAGAYLGSRALDELVKVLKDNYQPYKGERLRLSLFNYVPCSEYQDEITTLLQSKVNALPARLNVDSLKGNSLSELKLKIEGRPFRMSAAEADRYWETTHSLQILSGTCKKQDDEVFIISHVFLGDLGGSLTSPLLIKFKIDPEEYGNTKDIHSLLIWYSLAKDAQKRGLSKEVIFSYLSEASNIMEQLRQVDKFSFLPQIKNAIDDIRAELGANLASPVK